MDNLQLIDTNFLVSLLNFVILFVFFELIFFLTSFKIFKFNLSHGFLPNLCSGLCLLISCRLIIENEFNLFVIFFLIFSGVFHLLSLIKFFKKK